MGGHWYDRVLDLLLGEDETSPKNRIILICQKCRLVNGQAPPGTKSLAELGKWKCFGCGEVNGEEDEAVEAVEEMKELIHTQKEEGGPFEKQDLGDTESPADSGGDENEVEDEFASDKIAVYKLKSGRPKGSKKKT